MARDPQLKEEEGLVRQDRRKWDREEENDQRKRQLPGETHPEPEQARAKRDQHDQEMETLAHIHNTEIAEKNARLQEHLKRRTEIEEEFKKRGESLDKEKEAELKRIVDESYNNPEKLARELAEAFGIKNG